MAYSLTAFSPWEGYRVGINGTGGRIELDVVERSWVPAPDADRARILRRRSERAVRCACATRALRRKARGCVCIGTGSRPSRSAIPDGDGAHGGGDSVMLDDMFFGASDDPLGRAAGTIDGVRSVIVGVAGNCSLKERTVVQIGDYGLPLDPARR